MVIARSKVMDYFNRRNREPVAAGGTEASLRLREIRDPGAMFAIESEISAADEDVIFNDVLLRALESIRHEFHDRTWQAFWKVVVEGRSASDVAADLSMKPGTVRVSKSFWRAM
jgi:RNA polymerase sigma-70 factor (ECF subfamily)